VLVKNLNKLWKVLNLRSIRSHVDLETVFNTGGTDASGQVAHTTSKSVEFLSKSATIPNWLLKTCDIVDNTSLLTCSFIDQLCNRAMSQEKSILLNIGHVEARIRFDTFILDLLSRSQCFD